jgi:hypothetical protein
MELYSQNKSIGSVRSVDCDKRNEETGLTGDLCLEICTTDSTSQISNFILKI